MSVVISSYSVSLGLDVHNYIKPSSLARQETNLLRKAISEARTPAERYAKTYDLLEKALSKGAISLGLYKRLLDEARSKVPQFSAKQRELAKESAEATKRIDEQAQKIMKLTAATKAANPVLIAARNVFATFLGVSAAKNSIGLAVEIENAAIQFEVLTGSAAKAGSMIQQLRVLAEKSPITFSGALDAAKTMLAFNVEAEKILPTVTMLSDVVGGNNARFKLMALAFSQMSAAGRLMGQDLLQMINAGFNPLQTISKITGESLIELRARMEDGAISSQEVANALVVATSEGGRFHGMTERLSKTMGGKLNVALSEMEQLSEKAGKAMSSLVITLTSGFSEGAGPLSNAIRLLGIMSDGLAFIVAVAQDAAHAVTLPFHAMAGTLNSAGTPHAVSDFFNLLDQRAREEAASKKMVDVVEKQSQAVRRRRNEVEKEAAVVEEVQKASEKKLKIDKAALAIQRQRVDALQAAGKHFEEERRKQLDHMKQLLGTPISSIEVGSEADAAFLQKRRNQIRFGRQEAAMASNEPTDRQLLEEAKKQLAAAVASNAKQDRMVSALNKILDEQKQTGLRRWR